MRLGKQRRQQTWDSQLSLQGAVSGGQARRADMETRLHYDLGVKQLCLQVRCKRGDQEGVVIIIQPVA